MNKKMSGGGGVTIPNWSVTLVLVLIVLLCSVLFVTTCFRWCAYKFSGGKKTIESGAALKNKKNY
jgi:hypothetical protein